MNKKGNAFRSFTANLNAILFFVGFPLFTTIFYGSGGEGSTSSLTILYRLFTLVIAFLVIASHIKYFPRLDYFGKLFLFFWFLYLLRIFYDFFLRVDNYYIGNFQKLLHLNSTIVSSLIPLIAMLFSKSNLNWKKVFLIVVAVLTVLTVYGILNQGVNTENTMRTRLNRAQNTLSFGFYSAASFLAAFTLFRSEDIKRKLWRIICICIMLSSLTALGIAASRGPLVALLFAIAFPTLYNFESKNIRGILILSVIFLFSYSSILEFLRYKFPTLYERIFVSIEEKDTSGRDVIFSDALQQIAEYPILGDWHLLYYQNGIGNFAHNIILDSWMSLGLVFGSIIFVLYFGFIKRAVQLIRYKNNYSFIGYLALLCIGYSVTTGGALPYKDVFNFSFGMIILTMTPKPVKENTTRFNKV